MYNNYSFTATLVLRKSYVNKSGECGLYLRITINRVQKYYSLNRFIKPAIWNKANSKVKGNDSAATELNLFLSETKNRADQIFLELSRKENLITHSLFEAAYFLTRSQNNFFTWGEDEIKKMKGRCGAATIKHYNSELTKLRKHKDKVTLADIDHKFLTGYEYYMRNNLHNCTNTVHKTFKYLKVLLRIALENALIKDNPFARYKVKLEPSRREYLTFDEVSKLEELLTKNEIDGKLRRVLIPFLFSCYTGLRYQDLANLRWKDIQRMKVDNVETDFIRIYQGKTKEAVTIPLSAQALKLLPDGKNDPVFRIASNQKCNDYLKLIAIAAKIDKTVTFHVARHTFATLSLNLGIPIEVVSKLLGHNELKTTQIYAKMMDKTKFTNMLKWNDLKK